MVQGKNYDVDITARDFSSRESFNIPRILARNPRYVFLDVFSADLDNENGSSEQKAFLKRFKSEAIKKRIKVLPLRSHRYDRQRIRDTTPDLDIQGLEDAAVCFFERVLQNIVFIKYLMPETKFHILLKPDGCSAFYNTLKNNVQQVDMGPGRPNDPEFYARLDFPPTSSQTEFYCEALNDYYTEKGPKFLHMELDQTQKAGLETLLSTGLKIARKIGEAIDNNDCLDYTVRRFK